MSFQPLSEANYSALHHKFNAEVIINLRYRTHGKALLFTEIKLAREGQGMSYGVHMNR